MKFLIVVVLVLATGVSVESRGRIFGGSVADVSKFQYVAKIFTPTSSTRGSSCGASVISDCWILTAAHCFDAGNPSQAEISLTLDGSHKFTKRVKALRVIKHEDYYANPTTCINDIALIQMPCIKLPSIVLSRSTNLVNALVTVAGFGLMGISSRPDKLQVTSLRVMDENKCKSLFGKSSYVGTQFCTIDSASSTCSGDSGSAVVIYRGSIAEQVGIVSFGADVDCSANSPTSYTRVSSYLQWINTKTGLNL